MRILIASALVLMLFGSAQATQYVMGDTSGTQSNETNINPSGYSIMASYTAGGTGTLDSIVFWFDQNTSGPTTSPLCIPFIYTSAYALVDSQSYTPLSSPRDSICRYVVTGHGATITSGQTYWIGMNISAASGAPYYAYTTTANGYYIADPPPLMNPVSGTPTLGYNGPRMMVFFSSGGSAPSAPTLSSPSNGATGQSITPTLSWNASSGATSYRVQVSTTSGNYTSPVYDQSGITGTSQSVSPALSYSTTYYWHVNATNGTGTSSYSTEWSFATGTAPATGNGRVQSCGPTGVGNVCGPTGIGVR